MTVSPKRSTSIAKAVPYLSRPYAERQLILVLPDPDEFGQHLWLWRRTGDLVQERIDDIFATAKRVVPPMLGGFFGVGIFGWTRPRMRRMLGVCQEKVARP